MKIFIMTFLAVWVMHGAAWAAPQTGSKVKPQAKYHSKSYSKSYRKAKARPRSHHVRYAPAVEDANGDPALKSSAVLVIDQADGRQLYAKNITAVQPIASITKLMTAMVVLDAKLDLGEPMAITDDDVDGLKHTRSRLTIGTVLARDDLMRLALMASENRAASALARAYPGGLPAFVTAMNQKGSGARHASHPLRGQHRSLERKRLDRRGPREDGRGGVPLPGHPAVHDASPATPCNRRAAGCSPITTPMGS